ncbi:MAG: hypothetical protein GY794_20305 [bacterium]|nr:hypothetical protein [bacterium]
MIKGYGSVVRLLKLAFIGAIATLLVGVGFVTYSSYRTETAIKVHRGHVEDIGQTTPSLVFSPNTAQQLPPPVVRYFTFTFRDAPQAVTTVSMEMTGQFRRPQTEGFAETTATQTVAVGTPAFVFAATTPIIPGVWARAYDAFAGGRMEMKAKILSTLTVVDERETPELNKTSLRRWLLESPLYPAALLPGGPVRWEPIDDTHARAIVSANGIEASLVATFRSDGSLERFDAEEDGDLNTPYHGSGEHVLRSDYQLISGVMLPMSFTIARAAGGRTYPFWSGKVASIVYDFKQ